MHTQFFQILKDQATFLDDTTVDDATKHEYVCFCNRTFTTPQGLASHKRLAHNIGAREKHLIDGGNLSLLSEILVDETEVISTSGVYPQKRTGQSLLPVIAKKWFSSDR